MKVRTGDLFAAWHPGPHALVITTNGDVSKSHEAVMGRGVALKAATIWPEIKRNLGKLLDTCGNHCFVIPVTRQPGDFTVSFPVKHHWKDKADLALIERSTHELVGLANVYGWEKVFLPRPGCGNGGLSWEADVRPLIRPLLDDRFVIVYEPGHDAPKAPAGARKAAVKVGAVPKTTQKRMAKKQKEES